MTRVNRTDQREVNDTTNNSNSSGFKVEGAKASRRKSEMVTDKNKSEIRKGKEQSDIQIYLASRGFREGEHRNIFMAQG